MISKLLIEAYKIQMIRLQIGPAGYILCLAVSASTLLSTASLAETKQPEVKPVISGDVAEAILKELKAIRQLLEKIEHQGVKPDVPRGKPKTASVSAKGKPSLGSSDAPITVVEFTDYQCPYCLRFTKSTFPSLEKKYIETGKVRWVALNLPLSFHKDARKASQAALCANEQGKFWEMRQKMFQHQKQLGKKHLVNYATSLGIDVKAFTACLSSDHHLTEIDSDAANARSVDLTGTPSFIIGKTTDDVITGQVVVGAQSINVFETAINEEISKNSGNTVTSPKEASTGSPPGTVNNNYEAELDVKGIHIGMTKSDFERWVKEKLGKEYFLYVHTGEDYQDKVYVSVIAEKNKVEDLRFADSNFISKCIFDTKGKLELFALSGSKVDAIFQSGNMKSSDFVKDFMSMYAIPGFSTSSDGKRYEYTSPHGYKISIGGKDKRLVIRKIDKISTTNKI